MAGTSFTPLCECDCGVPGAGRHVLADVPPDDPWPRCVCPYCGPEPEQEGDRRQCATAVHPIVAVFTPGNLLLCEECRTSCFRLMRKAKMVKRGRHGVKRSTQTDDAEGHKKDEKDENHHNADGDVLAE